MDIRIIIIIITITGIVITAMVTVTATIARLVAVAEGLDSNERPNTRRLALGLLPLGQKSAVNVRFWPLCGLFCVPGV